MKLEFHPEAEEEFLQAALSYEAELAGLGARFDAELRAACEILSDYPDIGVQVDPDLRKLVLETFPYSLVYSHVGDTLYILAVAHERRREGYWRERS